MLLADKAIRGGTSEPSEHEIRVAEEYEENGDSASSAAINRCNPADQI